MWFIGIDWAEKHLDYCLEEQNGDVMSRARINNDEDGFSRMLTSISKLGVSFSEIAVAIESPHQNVVDFLLARGVAIYPVNPKSIYDYRKSRKVSGSKSDAADAQLIASYLREHHKALRPWSLPEPRLRQLQLLLADRDKLVTQKVRLQHQLRSTLRSYFPQAIDTFSDLTCPTALDFLSQFPTFSATRAKSQEYWLTFLDKHSVYKTTPRQRFLAALSMDPITVDEAVVVAKSLFTKTIVSQLKSITAALADYHQRIKDKGKVRIVQWIRLCL